MIEPKESLLDVVGQLVNAAVLAEREACAQACENYMRECLHDDREIQKHWHDIKSRNDTYAALIRARTPKG